MARRKHLTKDQIAHLCPLGVHITPTHYVQTRLRNSLFEHIVHLQPPSLGGVSFAVSVEDPCQTMYSVRPDGTWKSLRYGSAEVRASEIVVSHPLKAGVYFVQQSHDGPIKVGWSRNIPRRMRQLQTAQGQPLRLLGHIETQDASLEKVFQERLSKHHLQGEWFEGTSAVLEAICSLIDEHPMGSLHDGIRKDNEDHHS